MAAENNLQDTFGTWRRHLKAGQKVVRRWWVRNIKEDAVIFVCVSREEWHLRSELASKCFCLPIEKYRFILLLLEDSKRNKLGFKLFPRWWEVDFKFANSTYPLWLCLNSLFWFANVFFSFSFLFCCWCYYHYYFVSSQFSLSCFSFFYSFLYSFFFHDSNFIFCLLLLALMLLLARSRVPLLSFCFNLFCGSIILSR